MSWGTVIRMLTVGWWDFRRPHFHLWGCAPSDCSSLCSVGCAFLFFIFWKCCCHKEGNKHLLSAYCMPAILLKLLTLLCTLWGKGVLFWFYWWSTWILETEQLIWAVDVAELGFKPGSVLTAPLDSSCFGHYQSIRDVWNWDRLYLVVAEKKRDLPTVFS